jgi:sigma-B regulation protein RsbU (phosphoserine phosphatase)
MADDLSAQLQEKDREIAELRKRLEDEVGALNRVIEITGALNTTLNLDELLGLIMSSAAELVGAETSSLFLLDEEAGELEIAVATGEPGAAMTSQRIPADAGIAGWVVQNAESAIVDDPSSDPRFFGGSDERTGFETRSILAVPLRAKDRVIGVVEVINKREGGFSQDDLRLAGALADQAGTAIDNARLYAKLADAVVTSRLSYRL